MRAGLLVGERFELEAPVGHGGMGQVWRAWDRVRDAPAAVKLLSPRALSRFEQEARVLESIEHPGVVAYVAHGQEDEAGCWIAMRWIEGESLRELLEAGRLPVEAAVALVRRIADAVGAAHRLGVSHLDIKPGNILLIDGDRDQPVLIDFGIAQHQGGARVATPGRLVGTPGYMAPEQIRGDEGHGTDAASDVFALGCVLYECLVGHSPFDSESEVAAMAKTLLDSPETLSRLRADVPDDLSDLVARMLDKEPDERPRDGAAVAEALADLVSIGRVRTSTPAPPYHRTSSRPGTRERRLVGVVLAPSRQVAEGETLDAPADIGVIADVEGARAEALPDGSLVLSIGSGEGAASDLASSAARCALALCAYYPEGGVVLATGRAEVLGGLPVGGVIDEAARLLATPAMPGAVRIDDVTAGLLPSRFVVTGDEHGLLLGGELEQLDQARLLLGKRIACVGRDAEMALLEATWEACVRGPSARAILLHGQPGTGKSRLRHELLLQLSSLEAPPNIWVARGDPVRSGAPFALLAAGLRPVFGPRSGDAIEVRRRHLRARVARHVRREDVQRITEFLGEVLGVHFPVEPSLALSAAKQSPELMHDQIQRALIDLLEAECKAQPLLLVLEDLHWGDLPSVKVVDEALRRLAARPVMVLAVGRPEVRTLFPTLWEDHDFVPIDVGPLTDEAAVEVVREALGPEVAGARGLALVQRSGGNAYFLEELIRAEREGRGQETPATVVAAVMSRVQAMELEARRVLRIASIFGASFAVDAVIALHDDEMEARRWLERLAEREALTNRGEVRGRHEYVFRHSLLREAAYASWTEEERLDAHRRAATFLETSVEATPLEVADHLERGGELARAARWLARAATEALDASDLDLALRVADRGLSLDPPPDIAGELLLTRSETLRWRGSPAEAEHAARRAMLLLKPGSAAWARAAAEMAVIAAERRRFDMDLGDVLSVLEHHADADDPVVARSMIRIALAAEFFDPVGLRQPLRERARGWNERWQDHPLVAPYVHAHRAHDALAEGEIGAYIQERRAAARAFERLGDVPRAIANDGTVGYALVGVGAYEEAEQLLREVARRAHALGLDHIEAVAHHNLGLALARLDRLEEARAVEDRAIRVFTAQGQAALAGASRLYRARIALQEGDLACAESVISELEDVHRDGDLALCARTGAARAMLLLAEGRPAEALERARRAFDVIAASPGAEDAAFVALALAEALLAGGRPDEAREVARAAHGRLVDRAVSLDEESARRQMMERVPEHRRLVELSSLAD